MELAPPVRDPALSAFSFAGVRRGAAALIGAAPAVIAFGAAFGAVAAAKGLNAATTLSMSAFVFAGAAQFAALEVWAPALLIPLAMVTFAINSRHLVLGATLHRYLARAPRLPRLLALSFLSDANWAATSKAIDRGEQDVGHLLGGGLVLWAAWLAGTAIGLAFGSALGDVKRFGVDVLIPAFFALCLMGLAPKLDDAPPWIAAGALAAGLSIFIPSYWAVLIGAAAGACVGVWRDRP